MSVGVKVQMHGRFAPPSYLSRAQIAEGRIETVGVIEAFDVGK
jgi:hypothetical protein